MRSKFIGVLIPAMALALLVVACGGAETPVAQPPVEEAPAAQPPAESSDQETTADTQADEEMASVEEPAAGPPEGFRRFEIVASESQAGYEADEEFFEAARDRIGMEPGPNTAIGVTQSVSGYIDLSLDGGVTLGENRVTVDVGTLTSDQEFRDRRVRETALQTATFPVAEFIATGIEEFPASYTEGEMVSFKLPGNLTVHGVTRPVTFDVQASLSGDTLTGTATTSVLMTDFNVTPPAMPILQVQDQVVLNFELTAREAS